MPRVYSLGNGLSSVEACFSTALDIEEVLSGVGDQLHIMVAGVIESLDTVGRSLLDCSLGRRDLGGHLDLTLRARAGTLSKRVKDATHGVAAVGALPLGFKVKLGLVKGRY